MNGNLQSQIRRFQSDMHALYEIERVTFDDRTTAKIEPEISTSSPTNAYPRPRKRSFRQLNA